MTTSIPASLEPEETRSRSLSDPEPEPEGDGGGSDGAAKVDPDIAEYIEAIKEMDEEEAVEACEQEGIFWEEMEDLTQLHLALRLAQLALRRLHARGERARQRVAVGHGGGGRSAGRPEPPRSISRRARTPTPRSSSSGRAPC